MKRRRLRMVVIAMIGMAIFGGCSQPEQEVVCPQDRIPPVTAQITALADRVVTQPTFELPAEPKESAQSFGLPLLVSDGMLLQALAVNRVWGTCAEEGKVAVRLTEESTGASECYFGEAKEGGFTVYLGAHAHGGSYVLEIVSEHGFKRTVYDVTFGELFLGCGQSNMGWTVGQCYDKDVDTLLYQEQIDESTDPEIRLFGVTPKQSLTPVNEVESSSTGGWQSAQPSVVRNFSACGYFFARELHERLGVPVGVIASCMGGTDVFTWTPAEEAPECRGAENSASVSQFYNGMIYPLRNVTARGVLWYQGEGDNGQYYAHNLELVINGWRRTFGRNDLFFAVVQLPRYEADDFGYFYRREAQKAAATAIPDCTYSVNLDLGLMASQVAEGDNLNPEGIHPYDKQPLGERLAHAVLKDLYGAEGVWSGPVLKSVTIEGSCAVLKYGNVGAGLKLTGLCGFEAAGADGRFADCVPALLSKTKVELRCESVGQIASLRYGYSSRSSLLTDRGSYADSVCLYNTKGDGSYAAYSAEQFLWQAQ